MEKVFASKKVIFLIIGIFCIVFCVSLGFIMFHSLEHSSSKKDQPVGIKEPMEKEEETILKEEEEEVDSSVPEIDQSIDYTSLIDSDPLHMKLSFKIDSLFYPDPNRKEEPFPVSTSFAGLSSNGYAFFWNLKDKDKVNIALKGLNYISYDSESWKNDPMLAEIIQKRKEQNSHFSEEEYQKYGYILYEDANTRYQSLFGSELPIIQKVGKCTTFQYDPDLKKFYRYAGDCGGLSTKNYLLYKRSFQQVSENTVEVFVRMGVLIDEHKTDLGKTGYSVYGNISLDDKNEYQVHHDSLVYFSKQHNLEIPFHIIEDNYENFCEFKFTFQKYSDDDYYIQKIEKVL